MVYERLRHVVCGHGVVDDFLSAYLGAALQFEGERLFGGIQGDSQ